MLRVLLSTLVALTLGMFSTDSARAENATLALTNKTGYPVDYCFTYPGGQSTTSYVINPGASLSLVIPEGSLLYVRWTGYTEWQIQTWQVPTFTLLGVGLSWSMVIAPVAASESRARRRAGRRR